jgi:hypothetical protein
MVYGEEVVVLSTSQQVVHLKWEEVVEVAFREQVERHYMVEMVEQVQQEATPAWQEVCRAVVEVLDSVRHLELVAQVAVL